MLTTPDRRGFCGSDKTLQAGNLHYIGIGFGHVGEDEFHFLLVGSFEVLFKDDEYAWGMFVPTGSTLYEEKQISIISTDQIEKAHKMITELGSNPQAIQQDRDGYRFFEVKDLDGNSLQISEEA